MNTRTGVTVQKDTPATYNRAFARRQWRANFGDGISFSANRQPGRDGSFRIFTGRTVK